MLYIYHQIPIYIYIYVCTLRVKKSKHHIYIYIKIIYIIYTYHIDVWPVPPKVMDADSNVSPTVNRGRKRQSLAAGSLPAPLSLPEASEDEACKEKEMKRLQRLGRKARNGGMCHFVSFFIIFSCFVHVFFMFVSWLFNGYFHLFPIVFWAKVRSRLIIEVF